jgi:hypothetical protein
MNAAEGLQQDQEQSVSASQSAVATTALDGSAHSLAVANSTAVVSADETSAMAFTQGKSTMSGGTKSTTRSSSGSIATEAVAHVGQSSSATPTVDAITMARDLSGVRNSSNSTVESDEKSAGSNSAASAHETFAALDGDASTSNATWVHTGSRQAEAGFQDPSLGWVGVRADASGTGIHASLLPGSTEAGQALGSHLAGLNTYLDEHHTPVESLTVATPDSQSAGTGQGMYQGAGQQGGQESQTGAQSQSGSLSVSSQSRATASSEVSTVVGVAESSVQSVLAASAHISVMA